MIKHEYPLATLICAVIVGLACWACRLMGLGNKIKAIFTVAFMSVDVVGWTIEFLMDGHDHHPVTQRGWYLSDPVQEIFLPTMVVLSVVLPVVLWRNEKKNSALIVTVASAIMFVFEYWLQGRIVGPVVTDLG